MSQKDKEQIIRDFLSGKYSEEGEALFNTWYKGVEDSSSPLDDLSPSEKEKIRLEMLHKVKQDIYQPIDHSTSVETKSSRIFQNRIYRYAAVWIGLLLLGFGYLTFNSYDIELVKVRTAFGELKTVTLPDGSTVTLNANSSLEYAETWNDHEDRQVWLDGEAYFSVVHTAHDQRFQVMTPAMEIEVLGTEFNVNNRQQNTEVVLVSGKVKLGIKYPEQEKELYMAPGDLVAYSAADTKIYQKTVNPDQYSAWRNHGLLVDNISLAEIAQALESFYGFDIIIIDDSLKQKKLSATARLSLEDTTVLFSAISEIYDIEIKQAENKIIFSSP
jgi:ferric-dicitrate binding protein FerR (iron transport regulator)